VSSISVAFRVLRMLPRLAAPVLGLYMVEEVYVSRFGLLVYGSVFLQTLYFHFISRGFCLSTGYSAMP
jgi:hypothetical protein